MTKLRFIIPCLLVVSLLYGCNGGKIEITEDPSYIIREDFDPNDISVYGVVCWDPIDAIDKAIIDKTAEVKEGFISTKKDLSYGTSGDKIISFTLIDDLAKQTGIDGTNVERLLGRADLDKVGFIDQYKYPDKGLEFAFVYDKPFFTIISCR